MATLTLATRVSPLSQTAQHWETPRRHPSPSTSKTKAWDVYPPVLACPDCHFTSDIARETPHKLRRTSNGLKPHGGAAGQDVRMDPDDKDASAGTAKVALGIKESCRRLMFSSDADALDCKSREAGTKRSKERRRHRLVKRMREEAGKRASTR